MSLEPVMNNTYKTLYVGFSLNLSPSSSSLQGGTSPVPVPASLSDYFHHQKSSGTVCLYELALHWSFLNPHH